MGSVDINYEKGETMNYPKIQTIWKRDESNKYCIIECDLSCLEFGNIKWWHTTEKINGTNIRIEFSVTTNEGLITITNINFFGKTDDAQIHASLVNYLKNTFTDLTLSKIIKIKTDKETGKYINEQYNVILCGEGYGPKVHKGGGRYRDDSSFILFDANIAGWWLEPHNVKDISNTLGIDYVPELGIMNTDQIAALVKTGFKSKISKDTTLDAEGIVARSYPMVLFRDGTPLMFKLKTNDYKKLNEGEK